MSSVFGKFPVTIARSRNDGVANPNRSFGNTVAGEGSTSSEVRDSAIGACAVQIPPGGRGVSESREKVLMKTAAMSQKRPQARRNPRWAKCAGRVLIRAQKNGRILLRPLQRANWTQRLQPARMTGDASRTAPMTPALRARQWCEQASLRSSTRMCGNVSRTRRGGCSSTTAAFQRTTSCLSTSRGSERQSNGRKVA